MAIEKCGTSAEPPSDRSLSGKGTTVLSESNRMPEGKRVFCAVRK
jgi:hypothetical protein